MPQDHTGDVIQSEKPNSKRDISNYFVQELDEIEKVARGEERPQVPYNLTVTAEHTTTL